MKRAINDRSSGLNSTPAGFIAGCGFCPPLPKRVIDEKTLLLFLYQVAGSSKGYLCLSRVQYLIGQGFFRETCSVPGEEGKRLGSLSSFSFEGYGREMCLTWLDTVAHRPLVQPGPEGSFPCRWLGTALDRLDYELHRLEGGRWAFWSRTPGEN